MPLLAPSGSVITLFAAANTVPLNGDVEIVANVIENGGRSTDDADAPTTPGTTTPGNRATTPATTTTTSAGAGTPVQNGTLVSFTTTLGTIEPSEARTDNGQVRVRFIAQGQSGLATITAFSGGASGRLENLKVGSAAVERVIVSASPQTLGPAGGNSDHFGARRRYIRGRPARGAGHVHERQRHALRVVRDHRRQRRRHGDAQYVTSVQVTANVAGKTADVTVGLNPRTGITIAGPTTQVSAGVPATFTVNVGTTANVRDVVVDFGDGTRRSLGAISGSTTINHTYNDAGTFNVSATAQEASGFSETVSTDISVLPGQPPGVIVTASDPTPSVNQTITFTATVSGATSTIQSFQWEFGDGTTAVTTGPQISKSYSTPGTKVVRVTVIQAVGPSGQSQTTVNVVAALRAGN